MIVRARDLATRSRLVHMTSPPKKSGASSWLGPRTSKTHEIMEAFSPKDLYDFLSNKGIPLEVCDKIEGIKSQLGLSVYCLMHFI